MSMNSKGFQVTMEELIGVQVATKLNDYIYELYRPTEEPDMDIIFVHGLQLDGSDSLHLSTWMSEDDGNYHAWPRTWLAQDFPHARVLTVAYDSHLYQTAQQGNIDLHNTAENLMHCLLLHVLEEGAPLSRPLVLVGYSFGGILIKQLCLHAFRNLFGYYGPQLKSFLNRIGAIYFMGTPHIGMIHEGFGLAVEQNPSPLFRDVELLNKSLVRLHGEFDVLRRSCAWQVSSIGETNGTQWGTLHTIMVPEGSARYGDSFLTVQADHISLSKPAAKTSFAYIQLVHLIKQAYKSKRFNWNLTSNLSRRLEHEDGEDAKTGHDQLKLAGAGSTPLRTGDPYCADGSQSGSSPTPGGSGLGSIISRDFFNQQFPNRNSFYTYDALVNAAKHFSSAGLGITGNTDTKKREVAAFLAHINHGTSGLVHIEEINPGSNYCQSSAEYRCAPGKSYHGRGPLQLAWNYNYVMCGNAIGENLVDNPELVAQDATIAFKTAIWFWSTPQWNKPSCHAVMTGSWLPSAADNAANRRPGFGVTINIINGGYECGISAQADSRVNSYRNFCRVLNVSPGENLDCQNQKPF